MNDSEDQVFSYKTLFFPHNTHHWICIFASNEYEAVCHAYKAHSKGNASYVGPRGQKW